MVAWIKFAVNKFLDNGLSTAEVGEALRRARIINGTVFLVLFWLVALSLFEFFWFGSFSYFWTKIVVFIVGLRFLFWHRKKDSSHAATILSGLVVLAVVWLALFGGPISWQMLLVMFVPPYTFLLGGIKSGLLWSSFVFAWMIGIVTFADVGGYKYPFQPVFAFGLLAVYVVITFLVYLYEVVREDVERKFVSKNNELLRLIYVISHDLRSPLTSFKGFFSFIKQDIKENNTEMLKTDLEKTELVIKSMEQMINELLNLSRIGKGDDLVEDVDTNELIKNLLIENESQFKEKKIRADKVGDFPVINVNKRKFEEVARNLLSNAIKYIGTPDQPVITFGVNENAFNYEFYVRDNGIGIREEDREKVFELFFQKGGSTQESSGVGLSVVKGFVTDMGGKVRLDSKEGSGSTFWFTIPKSKK